MCHSCSFALPALNAFSLSVCLCVVTLLIGNRWAVALDYPAWIVLVPLLNAFELKRASAFALACFSDFYLSYPSSSPHPFTLILL